MRALTANSVEYSGANNFLDSCSETAFDAFLEISKISVIRLRASNKQIQASNITSNC